ncbi:MAG: nucleotidyltransferase family protein [Paracoccaceae bacterium]
MKHLRFAQASEAARRDALFEIVRASPVLMQVFERARELDLPDWWVVSGAIYNQVWNHLSGRADMYGVNDVDLFYFDPDTGYEAEDRVIREAVGFPEKPPIEIRNQARVHLWYEQHFGEAYTPLRDCREAIDRFACRTHCVGMRLREDGEFDLYAPFGLGDIFGFRVVPNTLRNNRETHERKAARQITMWPELKIVQWPE